MRLPVKIEENPEWILKGQADLIASKGNNTKILDVKLAKHFTIKKLQKAIENKDYTELEKNSYATQLNTYRYLLWKLHEIEAQELELVCFIKDGTQSMTRDVPHFVTLKVPHLGHEWVESNVKQHIEELEFYISGEKKPPKRCEDVWERDGVGMKCLYYCDFKEYCEFGQLQELELQALKAQKEAKKKSRKTKKLQKK